MLTAHNMNKKKHICYEQAGYELLYLSTEVTTQHWQISHVTQVSVMAVTEHRPEAVCEVSVSKPAPVLRFGDFICENANAR